MEPKFIKIDDNTLVNLAQVVAVDLKVYRTNDVTNRQYVGVYTTSGKHVCYWPYIDGLKAAIADLTI